MKRLYHDILRLFYEGAFTLNKGLLLVTQVIWLQGILPASGDHTDIRRQFWQQMVEILRKKTQMLNLYIGLCAAGEHFW